MELSVASPVRAPLGLAWLEQLAEQRVTRAFARSGVRVDGPAPWDPQVHRRRAFLRILLEGRVGTGESYVDGDWDCDALDELAARTLQRDTGAQLTTAWALYDAIAARLVNQQTAVRARRNGAYHYDLGNPLYEAMLGPTMTYSCGYWRHADDLDAAQRDKISLIADKLRIGPGQRVLDIGCGWGTFAAHAARLGAHVVGVTVSRAQARFAEDRCRDLPVEIRLCDYRSLDEKFDRVVSVGMFEHVGAHNHETFMAVVDRCLAEGGVCLLHSIGAERAGDTVDPWIDRHIFPGASLPALSQIASMAERHFVIEDVHNFGADYDRTLIAWRDRFDAAWATLRDRYDDRFRRMWRYYLSTCAGAFRARRCQLWQVVLSRGIPGGYASVR
jgi:cyclopropane-fatty-acyl-phospholipid synthase